jgi:hypothetical protein
MRKEQNEATRRRFAPNGRLHRTAIDTSRDLPDRAFYHCDYALRISDFDSGPITSALQYTRLAVAIPDGAYN